MKFLEKYRIVLTTEERKERKKNLLLGLLSGVMLGISYPPIPLPFLSFFAFIPFLYVLEKKETLASLNRFTYFILFFFNLITLYWVGSWTKEADTFLMISGAALLFFNPFFYLIIPTLYHFSKKTFGKRIALFLFPFYWVTFEYLYSLTDLRFPWLTLGNCLPYFNTFIQAADIVGVYGLSLIILFLNIFIYLSIKDLKEKKKIDNKFALAAVALFFVVMIYGVVRINSFKIADKKIKVGLIQPNLNPWDKWKAGNLDDQLSQYLELSQSAINKGAKLIIWPESALPVYLLSGNYTDQVDRIHNFVSTKNIFLMTGMPDVNFYFNKNESPKDAKETKSGVLYTSYNSILLFTPYSLEVQKYGKIKLVPFGEHVPFVEELPFLGDFIKWEVGISSWNVGKTQTVFNLNESNNLPLKVGGVVCIESIYPEFVAGFVQQGANLLVVVTNDSWYGNSSGPYQHKEISVLRAVENRKTVVRAANGGVTCIIDPLGRTIASTKLFTRDILVVDATIEDGMTFYSRYPSIMPLFSSFISIGTFLFFIYKKISTKLKKSS
ncbi:MAG: apolipoprotein N-acyltransferase [Ignavibacteriales bacterium]|nr:apolipoprotein N-acyltransferase [Ignavibacteriales bacterium]